MKQKKNGRNFKGDVEEGVNVTEEQNLAAEEGDANQACDGNTNKDNVNVNSNDIKNNIQKEIQEQSSNGKEDNDKNQNMENKMQRYESK